jgi:hypothetical protein
VNQSRLRGPTESDAIRFGHAFRGVNDLAHRQAGGRSGQLPGGNAGGISPGADEVGLNAGKVSQDETRNEHEEGEDDDQRHGIFSFGGQRAH